MHSMSSATPCINAPDYWLVVAIDHVEQNSQVLHSVVCPGVRPSTCHQLDYMR
jgi:hypothetical protein